jgi:hypothetical protein
MASLTPSNKEELRLVETLGSSVSPSTSCERDASVDAEDQSDPLMSDESSFGTNPLTTDLSSRKDTDKALHDQEERSLCGARFLFLVILLIAAVSLGAMVYLITQSDAQSDFEIEFINSSTEVRWITFAFLVSRRSLDSPCTLAYAIVAHHLRFGNLRTSVSIKQWRTSRSYQL